MDNNLQIRNSAVEFLIFISQDGELDENEVCRDLRHTSNNKFLNYTFDNVFKSLNIENHRKEIL